jgi:outer membrane protein OmpA-like peptidoglycan-associated protein
MPFSRCASLALLLAVAGTAPLGAQQRRYLIEAGAAGSYLHFDGNTNLKAGAGGVGRIGLWLHRNLSVEGEFGLYSSESRIVSLGSNSWNVQTYGGSLLGNLPVGSASSVFLRVGYGVTKYDADVCPASTILGPCGSTGAVQGGVGARMAISPTIMIRLDGIASHASSSVGGASTGITNLGASLGLSVMLGSKPLTDSDQDRVYDIDDRCPDTPLGALTDRDGCPTDTDGDDVFDGLDRCPTTPAGARVNDAGCPLDTDGDNVPDGLDACADTPAGAAVNDKGCPEDSDGDGVANGVDRCPDTPAGASVDQLGCPGDEDGDRVLDGLDRCPRTPAGTTVNAFGCPPGVPPGTEGGGELTPGSSRVLTGVQFAPRSARLPASGRPTLDSLATLLSAHADVTVEIAAYGDGTAQETQTLTQLRAEAVRRYLITRGVALQQLVAKGYGNADPLTSGSDAAAQNRNRRIEVHVLPAR